MKKGIEMYSCFETNYFFLKRGTFLLLCCVSMISISLAQDSQNLRKLAPYTEKAEFQKRAIYEPIDRSFCDDKTRDDSFRCGVPGREPKLDSRPNGQEVEPFSYPYMVGIYHYLYWRCTGAVISTDLVVTSAHCVTYDSIKKLQSLTILTGMHKTQATYTHIKSYHVKERVVHHLYDRSLSTSPYDIALLQTEEKMNLTCYLRTACISGVMPPINSGPCLAVGWGENIDGDQYPYYNALHQQNMPIINDNICRRSFPETANNYNSNYLCAGYQTSEKGNCVTNSSSPLICYYNGYYYLQGVASAKRGFECANDGRIGIYTNVFNFINWINGEARRIGADTPNTGG